MPLMVIKEALRTTYFFTVFAKVAHFELRMYFTILSYFIFFELILVFNHLFEWPIANIVGFLHVFPAEWALILN